MRNLDIADSRQRLEQYAAPGLVTGETARPIGDLGAGGAAPIPAGSGGPRPGPPDEAGGLPREPSAHAGASAGSRRNASALLAVITP